MKVFKFGGASVKDAEAVRNVARIMENYRNEQLVVVISAMGKTTNALEKVLEAWFSHEEQYQRHLEDVIGYHQEIIQQLFPARSHPVYFKTDLLFGELEGHLSSPPDSGFDFHYDQVVSMGELISTTIISEYLNEQGIKNLWLDARELIRTDHTWREAKVDWESTEKATQQLFSNWGKNDPDSPAVVLRQGFIASTVEGHSTTLGREGSDYTAAIFSYVLDASEMVIWKDVPGLLNADPKFFPDARMLDSISYHEAIELAYYGATIIHPKTIKPLQNKDIPLKVKSFLDFQAKGSVIQGETSGDNRLPSYIFKVNQVLISISPRDFSFIDENSLSEILSLFADHQIHIRMMQNSALSFSVCVDNNERRLPNLFAALEKTFKVRYNTGLELITIRHYDQETIDRVLQRGKTTLLEMRSRVTAQFVVKPKV